ncbi:TPR repeat-containing protein [Caballeronia insecticola]|uniref:TPR repeat-containing protein n=1 Tax=Caballeronia insecticola TaxID=758793 RepID=R4WWH1_9BURK|nr:TPR repeat-containing protein [Caballeronia insecticola]
MRAQEYLESGIAAHRQARHSEAEAHYRRAVDINPTQPEALNNLGVLLDDTGRSDEAEDCYQQAILLRPDYLDALKNLAASLSDSQQWDKAEQTLKKALAVDPANVAIHLHLARVLGCMGRIADAEACLRHALILQPDNVQTCLELGRTLEAACKPAEAETQYRKSISVAPHQAETHVALAKLLVERKSLQDAESEYRHALRLQPDDAETLSSLGMLLQGTERVTEAEACFRAALRSRAEHIPALGNLADLLNNDARYAEAEACYRRILEIDPRCIEALNNLGRLLEDAHRFDEAETYYRQVLTIEPERVPTVLNLSLLLLKRGRLKEAWPLYESRYADSPYWGDESAMHAKPPFPFKEWQGEPLAGRSLLVRSEQGFGDSLHFARYLPQLKRLGVAKLTLVCPAALVSLLETVEGVDVCISETDVNNVPAHDFWCFTMSLPLRFGTTLDTIPASVPYLRAPAERQSRWAGRFSEDSLKIGLVWAGDPRPSLASAHLTDRRRSLNAQAYLPLLRIPGITFVSLQLGNSTRPQIKDLPPELRPLDVMDEVNDFADTAALIEQLDLVITVDTSVAHLAGALARPVWILSRFDGCWRWLLDRDDAPWYPSARLFRQTRPGDWTGVIDRVTQALSTLTAKKN